MGSPNILLTGATGYIGGTILTTLLASTEPSLNSFTITLLVRGEQRAKVLKEKYGARVRLEIYKDLDDLEKTTAVASQHDIVINTTPGAHGPSVLALLEGLAKRKAATGRDVFLIHTSGTSNLSDQPISGKYIEHVHGREFDDSKDDVYSYEKDRESLTNYPQRTVELAVIDRGLELGVKTLVIMSPLIYGIGTGLFNTVSIQIPALIKGTVKYGKGMVIGSGSGEWDHVHVVDLANLYKIALLDFIDNEGKNLPGGEKGIIFSANGRHSWLEVAQAVAEAVFEQGEITDKTTHSLSLSETQKVLDSFDEDALERGLASSARNVSSVARSLGWKPTRGKDAWNIAFQDDAKAVLARS